MRLNKSPQDRPVRIATRGSALALWQARHVAERLRSGGLKSELVVLKTTGDLRTDVALSKVGGKGLFTKELENALLDGGADLAVHSMKDVPTVLPPGLILGAMLEREDPRDVLLFAEGSAARSLADLPAGTLVGTSSLRRRAQLLRHRPDLEIRDLRGNVDTRLRKLDEGRYDAIVLAAAGLLRMGFAGRISQFLEPDFMVPAAGQGSVGLEIRDGDERIAAIAGALNHGPSRRAIEAERGLLHRLEGGCQVPIGLHAVCGNSGAIHLRAAVLSPDGTQVAEAQAEAADPEAAADKVHALLLDRGAAAILAAL